MDAIRLDGRSFQVTDLENGVSEEAQYLPPVGPEPVTMNQMVDLPAEEWDLVSTQDALS
ncbi:hypothetical protein [Actinomadura monticuli]|uniref:Uncharacterized protein n=1 Tax=Actinomadura monticuli TaxID=3097367 RepID=A0ABV4QG76_9ACTN